MRGLVPAVVFTKLPSVMVAKDVSVRVAVQLVLPNAVYVIVGGAKSPTVSYAPMVGVVTFLVVLLKSVVIPAIGVPAPTIEPAVVGCKLVVEPKLGSAEIELTF